MLINIPQIVHEVINDIDLNQKILEHIKMKDFDKQEINSLEDRDRINLINSLIGVKSVNLIGTTDKIKTSNLAIISSLFHLGASPALFGFVIRPDTVTRDTLNNLREHPYLTVNQVHQGIIEKAHQTSARYDSDKSEFKECLLTEEFYGDHPVPFVKESLIKFGAKFIREIKVEENGTHIIVCEITSIHLPNDVLKDNFYIDITKSNSVGVSGLDTYLELKNIGKLSYAKPGKELEWIDKSTN